MSLNVVWNWLVYFPLDYLRAFISFSCVFQWHHVCVGGRKEGKNIIYVFSLQCDNTTMIIGITWQGHMQYIYTFNSIACMWPFIQLYRRIISKQWVSPLYELSINSFEKKWEKCSVVRSFQLVLALHVACKGMSIVGGILIALRQRYMLNGMKATFGENMYSIES